MSTQKEENKSQDLAKSRAAFLRAALRARKLAEQTKTPLGTYRDGKIHKTLVCDNPSIKNSR